MSCDKRCDKSSDKTYPYVNHMNIMCDALQRIDVPSLVAQCTDQWYNQTLCQVNDSVVRLGIMVPTGDEGWRPNGQGDL